MFFSRKLRRSSITIMFCAQLGEFRDQFHIDGIAHAHLQNREHARSNPDVGQHMLQIRPSHAGDDESQGAGADHVSLG